MELSAHGQLKTEKLHEGLYLYEPKSTAHFTYPLSRVYDLPVVHEVSLPLLFGSLVACQRGWPARIQALKAMLWVFVSSFEAYTDIRVFRRAI